MVEFVAVVFEDEAGGERVGGFDVAPNPFLGVDGGDGASGDGEAQGFKSAGGAVFQGDFVLVAVATKLVESRRPVCRAVVEILLNVAEAGARNDDDGQ